MTACTSPEKGCISRQFQLDTELTETEKHLLNQLEQPARCYPAGTQLTDASNQAGRFFTLISGWACAVRTLPDGQRQILDIFLPGQIIGLREITFEDNLSEFRALTDVEACPFPKSRLTDIFHQTPRLTELFFMTLAREQSLLIERIVNMGRRDAAERLAHFIIEIQLRLSPQLNHFILPMNQSMIGDTLGLSSVHVSRTLKFLSDEGFIEKHDQQIHILNFPALAELAGFDKRYLSSNQDWLSAS